MITRRCTQRQFLMRPDRETNNAFIYCLAVAAEKFGIHVLFTAAMSNHHHTGIRDPSGNYPAFIEHFHKLFAKCQNALRGRWENFWSSEQTSVVRFLEPDDAIAKMTYALTNPVKDRLVEQAHHWPGVTSLSSILHSKDLVATRPKHFFREEGSMPEAVQLPFHRPSGFESQSPQEFVAMIMERIRVVEENAAIERRRTGASVLGRKAALAQDWRESPTGREARRQMNPHIAGQSKWSRIEALLRNRAFRDAYAAARESFSEGVRDVLFPAGTYWLRRFTNAACVPSPVPT
jgi:putative transposase